MTIRTRLTLWYAGILLGSVVVIGGGMYYELIVERRAAKAQRLPKERMEHKVGEIVLLYTLPSMLVAFLGGWWLTRRALAPLNTLTRAAERVHLHTLSEKLPRTGTGDEVDRLSTVLNAMTDRLDRSFLQMKEFTLHASHEMKTPLAVLQGEIELCLQDASATPAQKEAFAGVLDEIQRLSKIVSGLDFLARSDAGQAVMRLEPVALHELVQEIAEDARMLGVREGLEVGVAQCDEVALQGDRHRLRQLLLNLTENALRYNRPGGKIRYTLERHPGVVRLSLGNTGPGILPEALPRVFDRFFRGDPSRSGQIEGCGLGLTIARSIVLAHQGEISIASTPGEWTVVTVDLPLGGPLEPLRDDPPQSEGRTR